MKLTQRPTKSALTPFRNLAAAACLVATIGCSGANKNASDYWARRYDETMIASSSTLRLTSEKTVLMGGTEVSFVIPSASLAVLDSKKDRQDEQEKREEGFYMRNLVLFRVPFGIMNGSWQQDKASIAYIMEEGKHYIIATFDKRFEKDPSKVRTAGVREIEFDHFPALLKKLGGGEIHSVNFVLDTFGMPTTAFAIPLDSKGQPLGVGPWGQVVAGVSFSPSPRTLIARPVVIPANGMSREEALDELADALGE